MLVSRLVRYLNAQWDGRKCARPVTLRFPRCRCTEAWQVSAHNPLTCAEVSTSAGISTGTGDSVGRSVRVHPVNFSRIISTTLYVAAPSPTRDNRQRNIFLTNIAGVIRWPLVSLLPRATHAALKSFDEHGGVFHRESTRTNIWSFCPAYSSGEITVKSKTYLCCLNGPK